MPIATLTPENLYTPQRRSPSIGRSRRFDQDLRRIGRHRPSVAPHRSACRHSQHNEDCRRISGRQCASPHPTENPRAPKLHRLVTRLVGRLAASCALPVRKADMKRAIQSQYEVQGLGMSGWWVRCTAQSLTGRLFSCVGPPFVRSPGNVVITSRSRATDPALAGDQKRPC